MVMKAQSTMKSKLHAFFTISLHGDMCSINTGNFFFWEGGGTSLSESHISLLHLQWPWLQQHSTSTNDMQHSQTDLNICINPLVRSPAQAHVLEFKCLPLSQFHSQIPKIYTFQTCYSLSLCQYFLCLGNTMKKSISSS
jgi:hypothetical protein